ncbi:MAG: peptide chain release factor N(5)-glutamine methyltransferase [Zetaproteobacteria bacterium]|nr:peptide chain release factor N(5)-glutamine methyltransferase [Zetaproteobacteria bacterium]
MEKNIVKDVLIHATKLLQNAGIDSARLDAELVLMHVWGVSRTDLFMRAYDVIPVSILTAFDSLLARRMKREPLAHLTGIKEFWSRDFIISADVLIPRPETEHLIEEVLLRFPLPLEKYFFADMGTGSGCIAITLACEYPKSEIYAIDISAKALLVARKNAEKYGVQDRVHFICSDLFSGLMADGRLRLDALISNPPYVTLDEMASLAPELTFEPSHALTDGGDGLRFFRQMLALLPCYLKPKGYALFETGPCGLPSGQVDSAMVYISPFADLAGHTRGGIYQYRPSTSIYQL